MGWPSWLSCSCLSFFSVAVAHAQALTFDLLHTFTGTPDGANPSAFGIYPAPFLDANGNLFGTTVYGGVSCPVELQDGCGTVFKIDTSGQYSVLFRFPGSGEGGLPDASLTEDAAGNLYGTTVGVDGVDSSTVFKLTQAGQMTVLHTFNGPADGDTPNSAPILYAGNLYGTTLVGGVDCDHSQTEAGCGVIYEVSAGGRFRVVHTFTNVADGVQPQGLAMDAEGNAYGATQYGGVTCGCGTVYKIDRRGKFTVLYRFQGKADGGFPSPVTVDAAGNVYGATDGGGDSTCYPPAGCGTIFKIDNTGQFSVLYTFTSAFIRNPAYLTPVLDAQGNFYDTSPYNGTGGEGMLFELDTNGNFSVLFEIPYQSGGQGGDGIFMNSIAMDTEGNFYGATQVGGDDSCGFADFGCGTVFKLAR